MNKSGKVFIYNVEQAHFYLQNDISCKGTGIHRGTGNVFYEFDFEETKEIFTEWCTRNK